MFDLVLNTTLILVKYKCKHVNYFVLITEWKENLSYNKTMQWHFRSLTKSNFSWNYFFVVTNILRYTSVYVIYFELAKYKSHRQVSNKRQKLNNSIITYKKNLVLIHMIAWYILNCLIPFSDQSSTLYPLKTSINKHLFSDVFSEYRNWTLAWNGLSL